jgi:hypothetical protein
MTTFLNNLGNPLVPLFFIDNDQSAKPLSSIVALKFLWWTPRVFATSFVDDEL